MTTTLSARGPTVLGKLAMAAAAVAMLAAFGMTPARADDGRHGGYERGWHGHDGHDHEWREHERREREWRRDAWHPHYPYAYRYYDPYAYYTPYYAPY